MGGDSKVDLKTILGGVAIVVIGLATFGAIFYSIVTKGSGAEQWQALGMLVVAVGIAFGVVAMLRYALGPFLFPQPAVSSSDADAALRNRIAPLVLSIGSIAIVTLAAALIVSFAILAYQNPQSTVGSKIDTLLTGVFGTVLPVIATWVGTVLAFYFGSENFRQAAQSTRDALGQATPKQKITDVMIPYERIARLEADSDDAAAAILMTSVINTMSAAATRVIVFNKSAKSPIYIIRSAVPPMPSNWMASDYGPGPSLPNGATIQNYLDQNGGQNKTDAKKFSFVDVNATADAALALMKKNGVDDLFITKDGQANSQVLGWVAQHDLLVN